MSSTEVPIPEGFTPWEGGERPIPGDTRFEMILRNGDMVTGLASSCRWWHNNMHNDIIAYRVLVPQPQSTEQAIQAAGADVAPRVTPAAIEANIASEHYFTAKQGVLGGYERSTGIDPALDLLTFCVLVLRNGFTVTGESACASPENFDAEVGRKIAREKAIDKIWPLLGYELRSKLAKQ